jgi:amino acid transporter
MIDFLGPVVIAVSMTAIYFVGIHLFQDTLVGAALALFLGPVFGFYLTLVLIFAFFLLRFRSIERAKEESNKDISQGSPLAEWGCNVLILLLVFSAILTVLARPQNASTSREGQGAPPTEQAK